MFVGDAWYVAAWSDEIRAEAPFGRRICGQPLVLFRDANGSVSALYDRCCHRGAPLSAGNVLPRGLQCAYHGLVFRGDGQCIEIPGQRLIPPKVRVRHYPVVEKDQFIWVWMGEPSRADASLIFDYPFHNDPKWPHRHGMCHVKSSYLVLADNLVVMLVGWEAIGLCSWGLVGFVARGPAKRSALIVGRVANAQPSIVPASSGCSASSAKSR